MKNLITGVQGLRVGHAQDERLGSGATVLIFEAPAIASIAVHGGAPGLRDAALLEPGMTVERVDALVWRLRLRPRFDGRSGRPSMRARRGRRMLPSTAT